MKKRLLSIVLSLVLIMTYSFSVPVFAATTKKPAKVKITHINLSINAQGKPSVRLEWDKVKKDCKGYQIYSSVENGKYVRISTEKKTATSKIIRTVEDGKNSFKIRAYNTSGNKKIYGKFSTIKSVTFNKKEEEQKIEEKKQEEEKAAAEEEAEAQKWSKLFTDKWYGYLQRYLEERKATGKINFIEEKIIGKDFTQLSEIQKIYALDDSNYFQNGGRYNNYCMVYDHAYKTSSDNYTYVEKLKNLYEGTCRGVCYDFAKYEVAYFQSLGLEAYYNHGGNVDHAWSVVVCHNSDGKEFYVPFDYSTACKDYVTIEKQATLINGISGATIDKIPYEKDIY